MRLSRGYLTLLSLGLGICAVSAGAADPGPSPSPPPAASSRATVLQNSGDAESAESPEPTEPKQPESTESTKLSTSGDLTVASRYLFQGLDYSEGKAVLQPNVVVGLGAFSVVAWGNFQPDLGDVNEIDLSVKYSGSVRRLSISPGYTYLHYPNRVGWAPSQELFVDLGVTAPLSPSLSLHYDFDAGQGLYATLALSHEVHSPVSAGVNLFYQSRYYEMTGVPAVELKASAAWSLQTVTVTPSISRFVTWSNGDFREAAAVPSTWYFSINVARQLF